MKSLRARRGTDALDAARGIIAGIALGAGVWLVVIAVLSLEAA